MYTPETLIDAVRYFTDSEFGLTFSPTLLR